MNDDAKSATETPGAGGPKCVHDDCAAVELFGVLINSVTLDETLQAIDRRIQTREPGFIVTPNVDHICLLQNEQEFRRVYRAAFLVLPDGTPLMWAARFLGKPLKQKISGSDLVYWLSEHAAGKGHSLFLLGAAPGVAEEAARVFEEIYPGTKIAGHYSPPLGFEKDPGEVEKILGMLRDAKPDICYVALGAPKQDFWNFLHCRQSGVPVSLGVGASLDFVTGRVKRAPVWMQHSGLEWLWRLCQEPGRLWRRYLLRDSRFLVLFLRELLRGNRS